MNLGWRDDIEDRSFLANGTSRLLSKIPMRFSAPDEFNPTTWLRTEDQGPMGSCTGWGRSTIREVLYYINTGGKIVQFSPLFGYWTGQIVDGLLGKDTGATISASIKAAKQYGDCFEEVFPYPNPVQYPRNPKIPQSVYDAALPFNEIEFVKCENYSDVWRAISSGHYCVSVGIPWKAGMANNRSGVVELKDLSGETYGGHCNAVVGWSKRKDSQGRNYLWQPNSHGPTYGRNGVVECAPACYDHWGQDGYSEMIAVTDKRTYQPDVWSWLGKGLLA